MEHLYYLDKDAHRVIWCDVAHDDDDGEDNDDDNDDDNEDNDDDNGDEDDANANASLPRYPTVPLCSSIRQN